MREIFGNEGFGEGTFGKSAERSQGMPSKTDKILEGPKRRKEESESQAIKPAPAGKGGRLTGTCGGDCLVCSAYISHGGRCHGVEHMAEYDTAVEAAKGVELYFEQYVDGSVLDAALKVLAQAIKAVDPMLKEVELEEVDGAEAAIGMLRMRLLDGQARAKETGELKAIIQECLMDLQLVEKALASC